MQKGGESPAERGVKVTDSRTRGNNAGSVEQETSRKPVLLKDQERFQEHRRKKLQGWGLVGRSEV